MDRLFRGELACPQCGFDLAGLPDDHRCPECGFGYQRNAIREIVKDEILARNWASTHIILLSAVSSCLSLLAIVGSYTAPQATKFRGWWPRLVIIACVIGWYFHRLLTDPLDTSLNWRFRLSMVGWNFLLLMSFFWPSVLSQIALALLGILVFRYLGHGPRFPHIERSMNEQLLLRLRLWKRVGIVAAGLALLFVIAAW